MEKMSKKCSMMNNKSNKAASGEAACLAVGYEKDIFAVFAYEFELLQNDISLRDMIYGFAV